MIPARWISLVGATVVALGPAWAETRVRSGEHATFTRLVLYLPTVAERWTAQRVDGGYRVDVEPAPAALDTSEVFDFIPRTRISDVRLRDGNVLIDSTCDCHVSVFTARPDALVIDVRDGPDPSAGATSQRGDAGPTTRQADALPVHLVLEAYSVADVPPVVTFEVPRARTTPQHGALSAAVARAATGGLLNPRDDGLRLRGPGIETRAASDPPARDRSSDVQAKRCAALAPLDEITAIDRDTAWRRIEKSAPSGAELTERALAYLSLGFGAEAAADFAASPLPPATALALVRAAHVIDAPPGIDRSQRLEAAADCEGVPGLLGIIAAPRDDAGDLSETAGRKAVATLSRLPPPLRAHLAPRLEKRLRDAGLNDLAEAARFTRRRIGSETPPPVTAPGRAGDPGDPQRDEDALPALPDTAFFETTLSDTVRDAVAAGRFEQEDRVLIEAWIQEAPTIAQADAASRFYVAALNRAGRPLDALAHLDARIGRQGVMRPAIEAAASESVETAARLLDDAALLVLDARLPLRPWYDRLPETVRETFIGRVNTVRDQLLGQADEGAQDAARTGQGATADAGASGTAADTGPPAPEDPPTAEAVSAARRAADAAIIAADESIARSAGLREKAAGMTADWRVASQP